MNLYTRETILSLDVMGTVHVADEGAMHVRQSVYICVSAIMLDQKPSRSSADFLQKSTRLIRGGRLGILDHCAPMSEADLMGYFVVLW